MENENASYETPKALRIIAKVLRIGFIVGLLLIIGWLLLRGHYQNGTPKMKQYYFTEEAAALYEEGSLSVKRLPEINDKTLDRAFYIGNVHYTEEISQFQFMLRYNRNNRTVSSLIAERGLHSFTFALIDDRGNSYTEYEYITDSKMMYGYYRLTFTGVDLSQSKEWRVYVFPQGEEPVDKTDAINSCVVWYGGGYWEDYDLSRAEKQGERPRADLQKGSVTLKENGEPTTPAETNETAETNESSEE